MQSYHDFWINHDFWIDGRNMVSFDGNLLQAHYQKPSESSLDLGLGSLGFWGSIRMQGLSV